MAKYKAPEGYLFSEESGLYYSQIIAKDENGKTNQIVTWFNADTGEYTRQIYPIEGEVKQENTENTNKESSNVVTEQKEETTTESKNVEDDFGDTYYGMELDKEVQPVFNTSAVSQQPASTVTIQPAPAVFNNQSVSPIKNVTPTQTMPINQPAQGYAYPGYQQPKKKSSAGVVIFALVCVAIIGICIGILWFTGNIGAGKDGNYDKLYATAEYKFKEGDYKTAAKFFEKIIKLDGGEEYAYMGLANSYYQMGNEKKAAQALQDGYDFTQSSLVYDEMRKFTEITGISFDESTGDTFDDDSEDSSDKGLFSLFGKKDKSDKESFSLFGKKD